MSQDVSHLQVTGKQLIASISGVLKAFDMYDANNATITKLLSGMIQLVQQHGAESGDSLRLQTDGENFFLNQELLRLDRQTFERASKLNQMLDKLRQNEFEFRQEVELESLREFMVKLAAAVDDPALIEELEDGMSSGATLRYVEGTTRKGRDSVEVRAEASARFYVTLQILAAEYLALRQEGKRPGMMAIRRTLQRLIDQIQSQRDGIIALVHYGRFRHGLEGHVARTSLMAGCIAHTMGLDRRWINSICLYAFPALAPLLALEDYWSSPTRGQLEETYSRAMKTPSRSLSAGAGVVRDLVAQYEASAVAKGDHELYGKELQMSLAGRIITVAAMYDTMRGNLIEGDRCRPISPKEVIMNFNNMMQGNRLAPGVDKDIVGVLLHMMGALPPGSVVKMENGSFGILRDRPNVVQLTDTFGRYLERPRVTRAKRATPLSPPLGLDMGPAIAWFD